MPKLAGAYSIALLIFLVLDFLWIGVIAKSFYAGRIGPLLLDQPRWGVAAIFYGLFLVGLIYFAIEGGLRTGSWQRATTDGALFGFFTYLTYNFTNLSVMKGYDTTVAVVDTAWGTLLAALVSGLTVAAMLAFASRA